MTTRIEPLRVGSVWRLKWHLNSRNSSSPQLWVDHIECDWAEVRQESGILTSFRKETTPAGNIFCNAGPVTTSNMLRLGTLKIGGGISVDR